MAEAADIEIEVDPNDLFKEEVFTDRRAGTIRRLTPVTGNGDVDDSRPVSYVGQAQILTPMGSVPLAFEIDATSLDDAARKFADAAKTAIAETQREIEDLRREAASSIVVPQGPNSGIGDVGIPGGSKIKLP